MVENLKKMDKKFLIFAACIVLLPIFIVLFLAIIQACNNTKISYDKYEQKMVTAAKKYFNDKKMIPSDESEVATVSLKKLVDKGYMKSTNQLLDDNSCKGSVSVRKNGLATKENEKALLNYIPNLECKKYQTNSLKNLAMKHLTKSGSGLYAQEDGSYIYRGDSVDNYVTFFGKSYRILSIDKNGIARLLRDETENDNLYWDRKYNVSVNDSLGINLYENSNILKKIMRYYNKGSMKESQKQKMVSTDICVDKRPIDNLEMYSDLECTEVLKNQPISLPDITDFAKASLDENCTDIASKSCKNYNYLYYLNLSTWTLNAVSDNTYEVYLYENGNINHIEASYYNFYNLVFYIDSNEIVNSGDGSLESPYVIN